MAKPLAAMTLDELVLLGHYHVAALGQTEETKGMIADFTKVLEGLQAAAETLRLADHQRPRVVIPVNFAERDANDVLRRVAGLARGPQDLDTPLYEALFPMGVLAPLLDDGETLVDDLFVLRERLVHLDSAKDVKPLVIAEVETALAKLAEALAALVHAENAETRAHEQAEKARSKFLAAYERNAITIAKLFPDETRTQDAFFDERHVDFEMMTSDGNWWPVTSKKCGGRLS
jgi:hypothetical protein